MIATILIILSSLCVVAAAVLQVKTYRNLFPKEPVKEMWIPDDTSRYPMGERMRLLYHRYRIAFGRWGQERQWRKGRKWRHASANVAFVRLEQIIAADRSAVPCGRWVFAGHWTGPLQCLRGEFNPNRYKPHYRREVRR